jgi:glycosyltransferase involved in cell wall biosynthesis
MTVTSPSVRFSAVIPSYNRSALVSRAIASALSQSYPPAEIVVVDDGSTDDTEQIVHGFGGNVRYVWQENGGGARARNRGVREATGEWVAFLDSDDVWAPAHLEGLARAIAATQGNAAVYFDDMALPDSVDRTWWGVGGFQISGEHVLVPDGTEWVLRECQPMMLQSCACRRETFWEEGGLWEELRNAHDTHFFLKIGIGRPLCAVSGIGSILTSDAPSALRLTSTGLNERRHLNKILAFRDILRRKPQLTTSQRKCLCIRMAHAYWTLGRFAWRRREFGRFLMHAGSAIGTDPGTSMRLITHALCSSRHSSDHSTPSNSSAGK